VSNIARWNLIIGFSIIICAASGGFFLATEQARSFAENSAAKSAWWFTVASSAHGHTNLFAMLHILLGLTLSYSKVSPKGKALQTLGLGLGTLAMSLLMLIRSLKPPEAGYDILGYVIGALLSASLISILSHVIGLLPTKRG
jgi:hypothetical protein